MGIQINNLLNMSYDTEVEAQKTTIASFRLKIIGVPRY